MRMMIFMALVGLGWLLRILGGLALVGVLICGVYALFAKSILFGFMLIGGAVVGGWVIQLVSGLLFLAGAGAATIGAKRSEDQA